MVPSKDIGQSYKKIGQLDFRNGFEDLDNLGFCEAIGRNHKNALNLKILSLENMNTVKQLSKWLHFSFFSPECILSSYYRVL